MVGTVDIPQARDTVLRETRLTWLTAGLAFAASIGMMLLASPGSASALACWVVSSIALATALIVLAAGETAWAEMVASAQAAGLVAR
ncbi:hypothetical protein FHR72_002531 [Mycolicibacterium iranicum]|uniref:Uncharacterized protein n=1 Tax=Mycolicibacterium iranicum TaxID=912594 RepID=A0A839Q475_MYCIR|nr:hypothetical protein [Mycolicibacterium iranicum]MBB2991058.1 hypothetical protein [Mycolicibacterium iranicum]